MEACLKTDLPPASELEGALRNGVYVAKLAMFFAPEVVKQKHIYDFDETVFKVGRIPIHTNLTFFRNCSI